MQNQKVIQKKSYKKPAITKKEQGNICGSACGRHWGCGELVRRA